MFPWIMNVSLAAKNSIRCTYASYTGLLGGTQHCSFDEVEYEKPHFKEQEE